MTRSKLLLLAAVTGATVANAYYIHPIIADVAASFGVDASTIGRVPAFNQFALALGIFLLLPLGDRIGNRILCLVFAAAQTAMLATMYFAEDFNLFLASSTALGFVTIVPYLLPAYVSKRVPPEQLGQATAMITVGIIFGILVARVGAGFVTEHYGWRPVYAIATGMMAIVTLALVFVMEPRRENADARAQSYFALLTSVFTLLRNHREVIFSGAIQALNFGTFLAVWLGLALHLTSERMGYGVDVVGYLAGFAVISLFATPRLGRWADKIGPRNARFRISVMQVVASVMLLLFADSLWLLIIPLLISNSFGPAIDVTSRMTFLSLEPSIRTRLMTAFIVMMFLGGGLASWASTLSYEYADWEGNAILAIAMTAASAIICRYTMRYGR